MIHIDFETRSAADLKAVGTYEYACDPTTEVICMAWAIDDADVQVWTPCQPFPRAIENLLTWGEKVSGWNVSFERCIWDNVCRPKYDFPPVEFFQWECTMSRAAAVGLPQSLEACAKALGLEHTKDVRGKRTMLKLARPRRVEKEIVWWNDRVDLETVYRYCAVDVMVERDAHRKLPPLTEREHRVWQLDQIINDRGLEIDRELCQGAIALVEQVQAELLTELKELTRCQVTSVNEIENLKTWLAGRNVPVSTLGANDVAQYLTGTLPDDVRRVLEIRQQAGKNSTAKYQALLSRSERGRMRGNLRYCGAATGRWSGSGAQIQNFPRGSVSEVDLLAEMLRSRERSGLELCFGDVIESAKSGLRGAIVAPEGKQLLVWDFAQIEARVLAWLAKEKTLVQQFRDGIDVYKAFAAKVFAKPEANVTKGERFIAKTCVAEGTLVLCDSGWKPIEKVQLTDLVWDGVEWVCHQGLINNGTKQTLNVCGSYLTPDHLIWSGTEWLETQFLVQDESTLCQALATAAENLPLQAMFAESVVGCQQSWLSVTATAESTWSTRTTLSHLSQPDVWFVQTQQQQKGGTGSTQRQCLTTDTGLAFSIDCLQQSPDATTLVVDTSATTEGEGYTFTNSGGWIEHLFCDMCRPYPTGTTQSLRWTESTTTKVTSQETFDFAPVQRTCTTEDKSQGCSKKLTVFDIACAGPRNRFTILTDRGPLIVHNCILGLGYGMGAAKFRATLASYGTEITEDFAVKAVNTYRKTFKKIVQTWCDIERDAVNIEGDWDVAGDFLRYRLPSGRHLHYYKAERPEGKLQYQTVFGTTLAKEKTYGGKLVENIVQGVARDVLVEGMFALEQAGIEIVATVHDEIIAESDTDRLEEGIALLTKGADWTAGLPLAVEGFACRRYRK